MDALLRETSADLGQASADVLAALRRRSFGRGGWRDVVSALTEARLLVPLLEVDSSELADTTPEDGPGCAGGVRSMAAVTMVTDRGTLAMAFTGMSDMLAWRSSARPMLAPAQRVASAALAEGAAGLLLDAGSRHQVVVPPAVLGRIAAREWPPAWADPTVRDQVLAELAPALAEGMRVRLGKPEGGASGVVLRVEVAFPRPLDRATASFRAERVASVLASSAALGELVDGDIEVALT